MTQMHFGETSVFYSPNKIVFGLDTVHRVAKEVKALGGTKVLIVSDKIMVEKGVVAPVEASLQAKSIPYAIYDEVLPDAPARLIAAALGKLQAESCDLVVGIGGGSVLDTAKAVSLLATNGGDIENIVGINKARQRGLPKILLSTTHAAGPDTAYVVVTLTDEDKEIHEFILTPYAMPDVTIVDPRLTLSMPPSVTADTGIDTLVTGIESYVSPLANPFSDLMAEKVISLCSASLPLAWAKPSNLEARCHLSLAATLSGPAFMSARLGAVHGFSYTIAAAGHLSHGRSMAVILPHIIRFNLRGNPKRYARVAELMQKHTAGLAPMEGAEMALEAVERLLDSLNVSYRLRDYGIERKALPGLAEAAMKGSKDGFLPYNPRDFNAVDVKAIFEAAY